MVALIVVFARRGGAGTERRPVWGVLAPLAIRICLVREQPVARAVSCGRGAASVGSRRTSEVGGRKCLVCLSRPATPRVTVIGVVASWL